MKTPSSEMSTYLHRAYMALFSEELFFLNVAIAYLANTIWFITFRTKYAKWTHRPEIMSISLSAWMISETTERISVKFHVSRLRKICRTNLISNCIEFLATDSEVPGSIPGATRFSEM
jgi:hypothetical protein